MGLQNRYDVVQVEIAEDSGLNEAHRLAVLETLAVASMRSIADLTVFEVGDAVQLALVSLLAGGVDFAEDCLRRKSGCRVATEAVAALTSVARGDRGAAEEVVANFAAKVTGETDVGGLCPLVGALTRGHLAAAEERNGSPWKRFHSVGATREDDEN
jgi:hypothetical protein